MFVFVLFFLLFFQGPAPSKVTDTIYEVSKTLKEYHISTIPDVDLTTLQCITVDEHFTVDVIDPGVSHILLLLHLIIIIIIPIVFVILSIQTFFQC